MPVNIDKIHAYINVALIEKASEALSRLKETEISLPKAEGSQKVQFEGVAHIQRGTVLSILEVLMAYIKGDYAVADSQSLIEAKKLEAMVPEMRATQKTNKDLLLENDTLKKKVMELQGQINEAQGAWLCETCKKRFKTQIALHRHQEKVHN